MTENFNVGSLILIFESLKFKLTSKNLYNFINVSDLQLKMCTIILLEWRQNIFTKNIF